MEESVNESVPPIFKEYKQYLVNFPNDLLIIDKMNPSFIA